MTKYQNQKIAAAKAGMCERSARKYLKSDKLPSELQKQRKERPKTSQINGVWREVAEMLTHTPKLQAPTILAYLQQKYPKKITPSHLRSLQRRMTQWRCENGPDKEVIFPQDIQPGWQSQSDYTDMKRLKVTIQGKEFPHLLYHFILAYSRWEDACVCFTESFDSLSEGYEQAVWKLGKVAPEHRTDNQSAVSTVRQNTSHFTDRWLTFMKHYDVNPSCNNPGKGHENGSVEKSHDLIKNAIDQQLMLRGSRDFESQEAYEAFVHDIIDGRNQARQQRVREEMALLKELPPRKYLAPDITMVRVSSASTITIKGCVYSVPSRLINYQLKACIYPSVIALYYGRQKVQQMKRASSKEESVIDYRHIIHSLVKKPGAFEHYQYKECLFPRVIFRRVYDHCKKTHPKRGHKIYLQILQLAALHGERAVAAELSKDINLDVETLKDRIGVKSPRKIPAVKIQVPSLSAYNVLLHQQVVSA